MSDEKQDIDKLVDDMYDALDRLSGDREALHYTWDLLLIEYIGDERVKDLYDNTELWYA